MKRLSLLMIVWALLFLPASRASARGDGWFPLPVDDFQAQACGGVNFLVNYTANKEYGRIVTLGGEEVLQITGTLKLTVTNLDTGQSIDVNASGPGMLQGFRIMFQGLGFFFLFPGQAGDTGLPDLFTTSGHVDFTIDEQGVLQSFELNGKMTNLCALLT